MYGRAPYRGLLTHGFTVDGQGRKMSKSPGQRVEPQRSAKKLGAEIIRLWVAASDYSGDIAIDDKILARVVDAYRRIRNTLRFLLANVSDFDPAKDAVPRADAGDRPLRAGARRQLQADILAHYEVYEFHPVVAKLQCTARRPGRLLPRRAQGPPLHHRAQEPGAPQRPDRAVADHARHAALDGAVPELHRRRSLEGVRRQEPGSIFLETYWPFPAPDDGAAGQVGRIREIRDAVNKDIEAVRAAGQVGSSLQATLTHHRRRRRRRAAALAGRRPEVRDHHLGGDRGGRATTLAIQVTPSTAVKCERCWHYRDDVGQRPAHPTICGRCTSNLHGAGEVRTVA
jgi:isoleucyl-tRNA synthetase